MPPKQNGETEHDLQDADFAKVPGLKKQHDHIRPDIRQAFQELNRGEQTATALETHLAALEAKIDELLAATGQQDQSGSTSPEATSSSQNQSNQSGQ